MSIIAKFRPYLPALSLFLTYLALHLLYYYWRGQYNTMADDQADYHRIALDLLSGKGFDPQGFRCFLQPAYIASLYYAFGVSAKVVFFANFILGSISLYLIYRIGTQIFEDPRIGYLGAALCCCNLPAIAANNSLFSEVTFVFCVLVAVWAITQHYFSPRSWTYLLTAAFFLALATLCREWIQYILLFAFPILYYQYRHRRAAFLSRFAAFSLVFCLSLAPWVWRNYQHYGHFLVGTTRTGQLLYDGANPIKGYIYGINVVDSLTIYADTHFKNPVEGSDFLVQQTKQQLLQDPSRLPYLLALKTIYFFLFIDHELTQARTYNLSYLFWFPFFLYGSYTLYQQRRRHPHPLLILLIAGIFWLNYLVCLATYGSPRFRYASEIYALLIAAYGICHYYDTYRKKHPINSPKG